MWRFRISERRLLLMIGDVAATATAVLIALALWAEHAHARYDLQFILQQIHWLLILPLVWLVLANANDYYNLRVAARLRSSLWRLVQVMMQLMLLYLATFFLSPRGSLPRRFIVYYAVISLVFIGIWRICRIFLIGWTGFRVRAVIVGGGQSGELIWQVLKQEAHADYEVIGWVSSQQDMRQVTGAGQRLGTGTEMPAIVQRMGVSELIMAYVNEIPDDIFQGVIACYEQGVQIVPMSRLYEEITGRIPIEHMGEHLWSLVLPVHEHTLSFSAYLLVKRLIDLLLGIVGLLCFMPLLPLLAIIIKLDSPGPVFYRQTRLGHGGTEFTVFKLRSMVARAEHDSGPRWATPGDLRMTRSGRWLRKTRLDEMPQFLNVLRGEMSIVGPRPERPEFVNFLGAEIPFYRARLAAKPGLTGWAQVNYRYGYTTEDALRKLQYDLYYIRHQSLLLDVMVIVKTVGTMLLMRGT
jgi:exopolysaccharide biosynthesis polyprenyl glycosylphosphotransferase